MNRRDLIVLFAALVALPLPTPAQKIPLEGDRVVQLHDVGDMVRVTAAASGPRVQSEMSPADVEEYERNQLERMAEFARTFIQPPLDGEEDIQPLGRRYLVALVQPQQQAWLEDLIRRQREAGDHHMLLEVRQFSLPDAQYAELFQPLLQKLDANPTEAKEAGDASSPLFSILAKGREVTTKTLAILSVEEADALMAAIARAGNVNELIAPRVLTQPMMHVDMQVGDTIPYVKDFEFVVGAAGETTTVPVIDELFDGLKISAVCGLVGRDLVGLTLSVEMSEVEVPIPTFTTKIGVGREVTVELPSWTVYRLEEKVVLPNGGTGLFAVQQKSGTHIVFLATVATID